MTGFVASLELRAFLTLGRWASLGLLALVVGAGPNPARAQDGAAADWAAGVNAPAPGEPNPNLTIVPRSPAAPAESPDAQGGHVDVQLSAFLTADGQRIDRGLVWRVYADTALPEGKAKLVATNRDATPSIKLAPGPYIVNVSFGRANLTRKLVIESKDGAPQAERFVINAGGLRVNATISGKPAPDGAVAYNIYSDRDQSDNRRLILSGAKPGLIVRLNSGIYHIESSYGDANAVVQSDVTVEAGKLTEATVAHAAAKVTLKLVTRAGGEALAGTAWTIQTPTGEVVKTSMGALPTHTLAPGTYIAVAKARNKAFSREFSVKDGDAAQVEVIIP